MIVIHDMNNGDIFNASLFNVSTHLPTAGGTFQITLLQAVTSPSKIFTASVELCHRISKPSVRLA